MFDGLLILILLPGVLLVGSGCTDEGQNTATNTAIENPESPAVPIPDIPIRPDDPSPISGRFEVVDFHMTPVAAIDEDEALEWLGQLIVYSETAVGMEEELCNSPVFATRIEIFSDYFDIYEVEPERFGLDTTEIEIVSVQCSGLAWSEVGAETFRVAGDTLVAVFDGLFLSLEPY